MKKWCWKQLERKLLQRLPWLHIENQLQGCTEATQKNEETKFTVDDETESGRVKNNMTNASAKNTTEANIGGTRGPKRQDPVEDITRVNQPNPIVHQKG